MVPAFLVFCLWGPCLHPLQILLDSSLGARFHLPDTMEGPRDQEVQLLPGTGGWGGALPGGGEGLGL